MLFDIANECYFLIMLFDITYNELNFFVMSQCSLCLSFVVLGEGYVSSLIIVIVVANLISTSDDVHVVEQ